MTARDFAVVVLVLALIGIVLCLVAMAVRWVMSRRARHNPPDVHVVITADTTEFVESIRRAQAAMERMSANARRRHQERLEAQVCAVIDEVIAELREVGIEVRA